MLRAVLAEMAVLLAAITCLNAAAPQSSPSSTTPASQFSVVLNRYCIGCHNDKLKTADLSLSQAHVEQAAQDPALWEKVLTKLNARAMPPAGVPRPDNAAYESFTKYLETELDGAAAAHPNPGRPTVHRLNRAEYANAIHDLVGLDIDAASLLPLDDASYGFDNIGDALTVSPTLLERYMSAAEKISRLAIGDTSASPATETYRVSADVLQTDRASESLPFDSRGGMAFQHYFPLDAEYLIKIRLQRVSGPERNGGVIIGLAEPHQIDLRLDGVRLKLFTIGGEGRAYGKKHDEADHDELYELHADDGLELRLPIQAGRHTVGVAFVNHTAELESEDPLRRHNGVSQFGRFYEEEDELPGVDNVTIDGPYKATGAGNTASRQRIFVCRPAGARDEDICARKIISTLAHRAYRRSVTDADMRPLLTVYQSTRKLRGFEGGVRVAFEAMLVSPQFLFRIERDPPNTPPGTAYRIDDLELASRLSFFLWSSIPDDELLSLAEQGKLAGPAALAQQIKRMLADSRSKALVTNFAGQWLYLRNMEKVLPDRLAFPDFDGSLREAFQQETQLYLESMLREDRSVLDLLNSDYTYLNERLARHYGVPGIYGSHFRRVKVSDVNRMGLLGQGSILTVTSYASRTSPTIRGKWLLENILGSPPPPPPNNVPSLKDRGEDGKILSVREQMEQHRSNPACAGCHTRMDPLGFALENFDGIGRWRTTSGAANTPIDASGVLPDGAKFNGPAELRKILLDRREEFVTTVTDKLLTYALGRGTEYYDAPAIRKIVREAAPDNYRWSALLLGVAKSMPFQMRRSPQP